MNIKTLKRYYKTTQNEISAATGIDQSRISRLENGSTPKHDEVVRLSNYFEVPVEMFSGEDIAERFPTFDAFDEWQKKAQAQKRKVLDHAAAVGRAPFLLDALLEHYATTVSQVIGKEPAQVWEEVERLYQKRVEANQDEAM